MYSVWFYTNIITPYKNLKFYVEREMYGVLFKVLTNNTPCVRCISRRVGGVRHGVVLNSKSEKTLYIHCTSPTMYVYGVCQGSSSGLDISVISRKPIPQPAPGSKSQRVICILSIWLYWWTETRPQCTKGHPHSQYRVKHSRQPEKLLHGNIVNGSYYGDLHLIFLFVCK